jgi:serpin B
MKELIANNSNNSNNSSEKAATKTNAKNAIKALGMAAIIATAVVFSGCSAGQKTLLKKADDAATPSYSFYSQQDYKDIYSSSELFASKFAAKAYEDYDDNKNFAVSPISVYMALSLTSQCANGQTKDEILSTLNISDELLTNSFSDFYNSLVNEHTDDKDNIISTLKLSNSVWVGNKIEPKQNCLDTLASSYHCSSYMTDFFNKNKSANQAISDFVKEQTKGLINKDFELSEDTVFALINTLYLKDAWDLNNDLTETSNKYAFTNYDKKTDEINLLQGNYIIGQTYEAEKYSSFYTTTAYGYRLKFILPNDGYTVDDVFTQENIAYVNSITTYNGIDEANKIQYNTRCLFPSFKADYDKKINDILKADFNINTLFDRDKCDLTNFADVPAEYENIYCEKIQHVTDLTVDKKGIEGAAVTVVEASGTTSAPEIIYKNVYNDFVVNKSFGFILTNSRNVTLFSGVVKSI